MLSTTPENDANIVPFYIKVIQAVLGPLKIKKSTENAKNDVFCMFFCFTKGKPAGYPYFLASGTYP
jgi:hypothetical protein